MQLKKEVGDGSVCDYPRGRPEDNPAQNRPRGALRAPKAKAQTTHNLIIHGFMDFETEVFVVY